MAENLTKKSNKKTEASEETALRLEWQPHTFEAYGKTTRIALSKLASSISDQFKQSFNDYLGTNIVFNGRNFEVTLIFEKGRSLNNNTDGDKKMDNLVDIKNNTGYDKTNLYSSMSMLNKRASGKTYELNDETKEILSEIMFGGPKAKRDWKSLIEERRYPANTMPMGYYQQNAENVCLLVKGVDFSRLLQKFFGDTMVTKTEETDDGVYNTKAKAFYNARVGKYMNNDIILNIEQFDIEAVKDISRKENPTMPNSNGLMYY